MKVRKVKYAHWFLCIYNFFWGRIRPRNTLNPDREFCSIVIYSTTALGDFMFNTPAIRAIRQRYPQANITLVAGQVNHDLVKDYPLVDRVIFWNNKFKNLLPAVKEIRKTKPELAIILHGHLPYDIISAVMAKCQYILRDDYLTLPAGIDRWVYSCSYGFSGHLIQRKLNLMQFIGASSSDIAMQIPCDYQPLPRDAQRFRVGFNIGASTPERCWPVAHFSALASRLIEDFEHIDIVLIGSASDRPLEQALLALLPEQVGSRVTSYIGKTSLPELVGVIASLDLLLTGDTGPLHLAVALRVPTLSLFVTSNPVFTGPYQDPDLHQFIDMSGEAINPTQPPLAVITVEQVYEMIVCGTHLSITNAESVNA